MARIAYLTAPAFRGVPFPPGQVHPLDQKSTDLFIAAAARRGIETVVEFWDDPSVLERGYDLAIIRTCWDYHERAEEFIAAVEAMERAGLRVCNPSIAVKWNARKTYLRDLGAAALETLWVDRVDAKAITHAFEHFDAAEIVVKPQIGAGSAETVRLKRNAWSEADLTEAPRGAAMIQTFLPSIQTEGERSLIWFGGEYSHAVRKLPVSGAWLTNAPGKVQYSAEAPPAKARDVAEMARSLAPQVLTYLRIDLVLAGEGDWRVIEVEAIEPYLFLDFDPNAADRFVGAVTRVLSL